MVKVKLQAMVAKNADEVSVLDLPLADWIRMMMWDGGYQTLQSVFDLLVKYNGDLSTIHVEIDGRKLYPYTPAMSDTVEKLLAEHPATKAIFQETFEVLPTSPQSGGMQTTLRQQLNAVLDRPVKSFFSF